MTVFLFTRVAPSALQASPAFYHQWRSSLFPASTYTDDSWLRFPCTLTTVCSGFRVHCRQLFPASAYIAGSVTGFRIHWRMHSLRRFFSAGIIRLLKKKILSERAKTEHMRVRESSSLEKILHDTWYQALRAPHLQKESPRARPYNARGVVEAWNMVPGVIKRSKTISSFKNAYRKYR